ncbi:MAG TPA: glycosyltransferase family 39 protein [Candidatus Limnocylindria bacterium]|nr:glycosyltransferase family 39 protein [Candidatus Limnocylindria bacterium]
MRTPAFAAAGAAAWWRETALTVAPAAALVLLALGARLVVLAAIPAPLIDMDGANFARTGENLALGYGYVGIRGTFNAVHISLYPFAIAMLIWCGAHAEQAAIAISLLAGALLVVPVYGIAYRFAGASAALIAGAIVAVHPLAIASAILPLADAPALTLACAGLLAFLRSRERTAWALAAGALLGLAYATRGEAIAYLLVAALAVTGTMLARAVPARAGLVRLAALFFGFAVFAVPYALTVARATGHLRLDTKAAVNYAIGTRIAHGMSYDEAANGLGPRLEEVGAELGGGFYATHPGAPDPPPRERLAFAARAAVPQALRLARVFVSLQFGTGLFVACALLGAVRGLRTPARRGLCAILIALIALDFAALLTLQQLWSRYAVSFVPLFAILASEPLAALARTIAARTTRPQRGAALGCIALVIVAFFALTTQRLAASTPDGTAARRAGAWIDADAPGPKLVLAVGDEVAFSARADWMPLPCADSRAALAYLHAKHPTYVVLERSRAHARPYLEAWLRGGIPDPDARLVETVAPGSPQAIAIYAWRSPFGAISAPLAATSRTLAADDVLARASVVAWAARDTVADSASAREDVDVLTAHNGTARLGWNDRERILTTANVASGRFGKLFELPVDGQTYAQPLVVTGVDVPGAGRRTLLLVATENDSVYAFDAHSGAALWRHTFAGCCGVSAAPAERLSDEPCESVSPVVGVSSTPVVDRRTQTLYVVAKTMMRDRGGVRFANTLHALSLRTGADRQRPVPITASTSLSLRGLFAPGHAFRHGLRRLLPGGDHAALDPRAQYNRPGLLLANGNVYVAFGSHCDVPQSHGWVVAFRAADLAPAGAFVTTRDWDDESLGSVWQAGFGLTSDPAGNVYFTTGNGPFNAHEGGRDFGDSLLRLSPDLTRVRDYFTPFTQRELAANDGDFGGGGMIALPDGSGPYPRLAVASSKVRAIFLLDRDHLGRYAEGGPDRVLQMIGDDRDATHWCIGTCGGPAYYAGPRGELIFNVWALDALRAYRLTRGARPELVEVAHSANTFPGSGGAIPSVSSNGGRAGTGIVWSLTRPNIRDVRTVPIELYAYDAADVSRVLYRGAVSLWPNAVGHPFLTPTIAGGRVYVGGYRSVSVFGLRAPAPLARVR